MLLSIFIRHFSNRRKGELALLSTLLITSCTTVTANAQSSSSYEYEANIRQTNITIAADQRLQQEYIAQVQTLKTELAALKKTPSNAAKTAQVQTQLNRAEQVEANLATNITNLSKWVNYWKQMESSDNWNNEQDSLDRVAGTMFDLNGDRPSPNELQSNSNFQRDQDEHDARLPSLRHYNTWSN